MNAMAAQAHASPKKKAPDLAAEAEALIARLQQTNGQEALKIAEALFKIAKVFPRDSLERGRIAQAIFLSAMYEPELDVARKLEAYVEKLGYEIKKEIVLDKETGTYNATFSMEPSKEPEQVKVAKRKRLSKVPKKIELPAAEATAQAAQIPEMEGPPKPGPAAKEAEAQHTPEKKSKPRWVPPSRLDIAEEYLAKLPGAHSAEGRKSLQGIRSEDLMSAAMAAINTQQIRFPPPEPPMLEGCGSVSEEHKVKIKIGRIAIPPPIPLYNPRMYYDYFKGQQDLKHPRRYDIPPLQFPKLEELSRKTMLDGVDKHLLISLLDTSYASIEGRLSAVEMLGRFKVAEAVPLLASIMRDPSKHHADRQLATAARIALSQIKTAEAKQELKNSPDNYALAVSTEYMNSPSKERELQLISFLSGGLSVEASASVAVSLALNNKKEGLDFLAGQLKNPSLSSRERRAVALEVRGAAWNKNVEKMLISELGTKGLGRAMAAVALGGSLTKESIEALSKLLDSASIEERVEAAKSLSDLSFRNSGKGYALAESAANLLIQRARSGDEAAAVALAQAGKLPRDCINALEKALQSKSRYMREEAAKGVSGAVRSGLISTAQEARLEGLLPRK